MNIAATHARLFEETLKHGTAQEHEETLEIMGTLLRMKREEPTLELEPMETVVLPSYLLAHADQIAADRHANAQKWLKDKAGARRTLAEETRATRGQFACATMLGLPYNAASTYQQAKAEGNLGSNISAFLPKIGSYSLIIREEVPGSRAMFLIHEDAPDTFTCKGWLPAGHGQLREWQRRYNRNGVISEPYVVPTDKLLPFRTWFDIWVV